MRYWWVNQKQTHKHEIAGGYMWSPKTNKNGGFSKYYQNMTEVMPGDLIYSYYNQKISAIGIATSKAYSEPKPEFGAAGVNWDNEGWMVNVDYNVVDVPFSPRAHIEILRPLLPDKYSPIQTNGNGNQVYLCEISNSFSDALIDLMNLDPETITKLANQSKISYLDRDDFESERIIKNIQNDDGIPETEKEAVIKARKGQGKFREDLLSINGKCPITGVTDTNFLIASHIKPWSKCDNNKERLDPYNGFALSPVADKLFDSGFISFTDQGKLLLSNCVDVNEVKKMGIDLEIDIIIFIKYEQRSYLQFHRNYIFKKN